jgi:hypothetical protein
MKFSFLFITGCSSLIALGLWQSPSVAVPVTVHFPRMPNSGYNFEYTYNVTRSTSNPLRDVGALRQLFQGPTSSEISSAPGLQAALPLLSATACGPPPAGAINAGRFMIKRQITGTDIAYKIRFCQAFTSGGVGDDARLQSAITDTLWANLNYVSGVNNITQITIARSSNVCLGGSGAICWP